MAEEFTIDDARPGLYQAPAIAGNIGVTRQVKEARELFERGMSLYEEGKAGEAIKAFTKAADLFENDHTAGAADLLEKAATAARKNIKILKSLKQ